MPEKHPYTYGATMIVYTLVLIIPRAIWPGKPIPMMKEVVEAVQGATVLKAGAAFPNLGEFYMEFGAIGCVVCMWIFGVLSRKLKILYEDPDNTNDVILYCTLLPAYMQLIARGYTPSNVYLILFLALPYLVHKFLYRQVN